MDCPRGQKNEFGRCREVAVICDICAMMSCLFVGVFREIHIDLFS